MQLVKGLQLRMSYKWDYTIVEQSWVGTVTPLYNLIPY